MLKLDLSYLEDITGGDGDVMLEMINLFIDDIPQQILEIKKAVEDNDLKAVAANAHKLKPTLQYVGLSDAHEIVKELEHIGKTGENVSEMNSLFTKLECKGDEFIPALKAYADTLG